MAQSLIITLTKSLLHRKRLLTVTPEFIEYKNNNFSKFEVAELRYGLEPIYGFRVRIGRLYCIDIKSLTGTIIKIRITCFYGIEKKKADGIYTSIIAALFDNYFNEISGDYITAFANSNEVVLLGVRLTKLGVTLREKSNPIPWADVGIRNYWTYCSVIAKSNPTEYRTFTYVSDWNAIVLHSVIKYILTAKGLLKNE